MVNSRLIRQLTSLVAAVAVVGAIGVLPAAATAGGLGVPVGSTTTLVLDNAALAYGDPITGEVSVLVNREDDDSTTGVVTLLVDGVAPAEPLTIGDQPLIFDLGPWAPGTHTVTAEFVSDDDDVAPSTDDGVFTVDLVPSSITLVDTSDLVFGAAGWITFVIDADLPPTGHVTVTDLGEVIAEGMVDIDPESTGYGTVTLDLPATLTPGVHTAVLAYEGNELVEPSETAEFDFDVAQAITTVAVWSAPAPLVVGQPQTLVVEVAPLAGQVAEGGVIVESDGDVLGEVVLVDGRGELELASPLPAGTTPLFLYYSGDDYYEYLEAEGSVEIGKGRPVVTVTAPASATYGDGASGTVTVRLPDGGEGAAPLGATTVRLTATRGEVVVDLGSTDTDADGALTFELSSDLAVGDWTIGASIDETSETFGASSTAPFSVTKLASVTTAILGSAYGTYGSSSTITAQVAEITEDGAAASGMVEILVDDEVRATHPLVGGAVTVDLPGDLAMGAHSVVVRYVGTDVVAAGESGSAQYTVRKAASATVVALSAASAKLGAGGAVATITVTVPAARSVASEGTVVLLNGTTQVGTYPLTGGSVAVPLSSSLALGAHSLSARFEGSAQVEASTSDAATLTIVAATTTTPVPGTPVGTGTTPATGTGTPPATGTPVTQSAPATRSAPARSTSASTASRVLAATGANVEYLVAGALALLALGTATTVLTGRRRSRGTANHRVA